MERLETLKEKGWKHLSKDEKKEYQELKSADVPNTVPEGFEPLSTVKVKDTITMTKDELADLVAEAAEALHARRHVKDDKLLGKWSEFKEVEGNNQTATLKVYQEDVTKPRGIIIKAEFYKRVMNPEENKFNKDLFKLTVLYPDNTTEEIEMDSILYAGIADIERVELIKNDRKKMKKSIRSINVTPKDKGGYTSRAADRGGEYGDSQGGYEVPLDDIKYKETFTCKTEKGQIFEVKGQDLNN